MNTLPTVAIVGRPNVGKSSLFNRIIGYRHAIVHSESGVTRDRNYAQAEWNGIKFNLVDTGGLDPEDEKPLMRSIKAQVDFALEEADMVVFLCDGKGGLLPDDKSIFNILRKRWGNRPIFVAINKLDSPASHDSFSEFFELGADTYYPVSAVHGLGVADLLDDMVNVLKTLEMPLQSQDDDNLERITIVGKPNVGKSLLFNKLLGADRMIVDDVPGTTRDSILVKLERNGKVYNFIDTAGLRRPDRKKDDIEQFSVYRTLGGIKRTDLIIFVLDASEAEITNQDKRIAARIIENGAGCIIAWNKWDIKNPSETDWKKIVKHTREELPLLAFAPIISISAMTTLRVFKLFDLIDKVQITGKNKMDRERLAILLKDSISMHPPPPYQGQELKLFSLTQLDGPPVVFKLSCSNPKGLHFSYERYLINNIRQEESFEGWPLKIILTR